MLRSVEPTKEAHQQVQRPEPTGRLQFDWYRPKEIERLIRQAKRRRKWVRAIRGVFLGVMGLGVVGCAGGVLAVLMVLVANAFGVASMGTQMVVGQLSLAGVLVAIACYFLAGPITRWADRVEVRLKQEIAEANRLRAEHEALVNWPPD